MTISFHRLTVPTYFGALPSNYDYINNAVSGSPAPANGQLTGGPNSGTYFVGFGDDATSANVNRPNLALAQNTDYLDNLLHQDIAISVVTSTAAGGPGVNSLVLPTNTFLGVAGTTNNQAGLLPYFHITDDSNNDIIDGTTGLPVQVASLTLTAPDTIGMGFSTNTVTAVFTEAIPTGRNYRIYYSTRTQLANLPQDAFINIRIRAAQEVPEESENLFRTLHGNGQAWDAAWQSTIWDLANSGLNERYNRATVANSSVPSGWPVALGNNTAASGAWFQRTGPGITGFSNWDLGTGDGSATPEGWMSGAIFAAIGQDYAVATSGYTEATRVGGETTGFYYLSHARFTVNPNESTLQAGPGFAGFFHGAAMEQVSPSYSDFYTSILPGATLTFSSAITASISSGSWFAQAGTPLKTAIAVGYDMIEVDFGNGQKKQLVITGITAVGTATFSNRDGSIVEPLAKGTATVIRWIRMLAGSFDNAPLFRETVYPSGGDGGVFHYGFTVVYPPPLSSLGSDNIQPELDENFSVVSFFGPDELSTDAVVTWGGYDTGEMTYLANGYMYADGSIEGFGLLTMHGTGVNDFAGTITQSASSGTNIFHATLQVSSYVQASSYRTLIQTFTSTSSPVTLALTTANAVAINTPIGSGVLTVNVTGCVANNYSQEFWIKVHQTSSTFTSISITCDASITVHFEGGTLDSTLSTGTATDLYHGKIIGPDCFMSVQRFPGV